jgi:hypothetical protein
MCDINSNINLRKDILKKVSIKKRKLEKKRNNNHGVVV